MIDVTFDRVSKRYRIRQRLESGRTGDPAVPGTAPEPGRTRDFWALREVSFQVGRGETLGLIGHNGAGKSTILKLLSQITAPTEGEIRLAGRVAALIEVGSGFHPELSGRENVYLSGAILGIRRREIQSKFNRIVEFSGVGDFIDTPVKWYSAGMYVRLGFAIATHLEPDILLVDEVLAVGDAAFQAQCLERLNELRRGGTTMLFISHDLLSIERLCDRVALMERGRLVASGAPQAIVTEYQHLTATSHAPAASDPQRPAASAAARVEAVTFRDGRGGDVAVARTGEPLAARVHYQVESTVSDAVVELFYYSRDGRVLHCQQSTAVAGGDLTLVPGRGAVEFSMPGVGLQPGVYAIGATIRHRSGAETIDWFYGRTSLCVEPGRAVRGSFYTPHDWRLVADHGHGVDHGRRA
jgi:ABC-type polysaccharide/polyol phosphate transport system ATPase subunit